MKNNSHGLTKPSFIRNNIKLWKTQFGIAWDSLPWDAKLAWIAFVTQTLGLITIIELILLKK